MSRLIHCLVIVFGFLLAGPLVQEVYGCSLENEIPCARLDIVEQAVNDRFWSKIWEFEKEWYNLYFNYTKNKSGVYFYSQDKICKNTGFEGERVASILFVLIKQTPREHQYQILHSVCGNDNFLKETWTIRGLKLGTIDWKKMILEGQRKFSLNENETYREAVFESSSATFYPVQGSFFPFPPTKTPYFIKTTYEKKNIKKVDSKLSMFGQDILFQHKNFSAPKLEFRFLTPSLFYRPRLREFSSSECYESKVDYFFAKDHREIRSSGSSKPLGLSLLEFNQCLNVEVYRYFTSSEKMLQTYYDQFRPIFNKIGGAEKNEVLKTELKQIISYVQNSNLSLAIELLKSVLLNVENEVISDKRLTK